MISGQPATTHEVCCTVLRGVLPGLGCVHKPLHRMTGVCLAMSRDLSTVRPCCRWPRSQLPLTKLPLSQRDKVRPEHSQDVLLQQRRRFEVHSLPMLTSLEEKLETWWAGGHCVCSFPSTRKTASAASRIQIPPATSCSHARPAGRGGGDPAHERHSSAIWFLWI